MALCKLYEGQRDFHCVRISGEVNSFAKTLSNPYATVHIRNSIKSCRVAQALLLLKCPSPYDVGLINLQNIL